MKTKLFAFATAITLILTSFAGAAEKEKIAYPTAENPSFIITVPSDWEMKQAEEAGEFFHLSGPTGAVFSFRTIKGTQDSLDSAIAESVEEAKDQFKDVTFDEPADWKPDGLSGFYATGAGKDKSDGTPIRIGMAWCALNNGQVVELWFASDATDAEGMTAAEAIANSLTSPE